MKNVIPFVLFYLLIVFSSCWKEIGLCKDADLSIKREDYNGNELRISGYYFGHIYDDSAVDIFFLYRNGVFRYCFTETFLNANNGTIEVDSSKSASKDIKRAWGVFQINGNIIEIERWRPVQSACERTLYYKGELQNDSMFVITHTENRKRKGKIESSQTVNDTFRFHQISQKPDSTNDFVN